MVGTYVGVCSGALAEQRTVEVLEDHLAFLLARHAR